MEHLSLSVALTRIAVAQERTFRLLQHVHHAEASIEEREVQAREAAICELEKVARAKWEEKQEALKKEKEHSGKEDDAEDHI
jgi:hypothetical protein